MGRSLLSARHFRGSRLFPVCLVIAAFVTAVACDESVISSVPVQVVQIDEISQRPAALVDILWVVDNSESMVDEQEALAINFERFINSLTLCQGTGVADDRCDFTSKQCTVSGAACNPPDYHIGVVATDVQNDNNQGRLRRAGLCVPMVGAEPAQGLFRYCQGSNTDCAHDPDDPSSAPENAVCDFERSIPFVTATTTNAADAFSNLIQVGIGPDAFETGIRAAARVLGVDVDRATGMTLPAPEENAGFIRDEATLFVIFVSDEDDNSDGRISYFYRVFETLKGAGNEGLVSLSAIVGPPDIDGGGTILGGCVPDGAEERFRNDPGTRYVALSMYSRGLSPEFRVCDGQRLTCSMSEDCQRPVPSLPGVCVPKAACMTDRDCGTIACEDGQGCIRCLDNVCQAERERFLPLLERTGIFASICDDYDEVLDSLGFEAAGLTRKFELTRFPVCSAGSVVPCCDDDVPDDECMAEAPVCVKIDGLVVPNDRASGWIYEPTTNSVFFDGEVIPPTGAQVSLTYRIANANQQLGCDSTLN